MPISSADRIDVTNRSACIRNSILIADSSTAWFFGGTGYEVIDEGPQQDELTDRKPRYRYKYQATRRRIEHPIRDLVRATMRLPDKEMVDPVVLVGTDHQNRLAAQRMKRISNYRFECQKPVTMAPARTAGHITGRSSRR